MVGLVKLFFFHSNEWFIVRYEDAQPTRLMFMHLELKNPENLKRTNMTINIAINAVFILKYCIYRGKTL